MLTFVVMCTHVAMLRNWGGVGHVNFRCNVHTCCNAT